MLIPTLLLLVVFAALTVIGLLCLGGAIVGNSFKHLVWWSIYTVAAIIITVSLVVLAILHYFNLI